MYKVTVDEHPELEIKIVDGQFYIEDAVADFDIVPNSDGSFHALYKGSSYKIEVLQRQPHALSLEINNKKSRTRIKNDLEDLLTQMGMDKISSRAMNELKAPMPGMVLKILVKAGQAVKKGDSLIVLEAMKMENNIKAAGDGVVSAVNTTAGEKVEKNQVLITF